MISFRIGLVVGLAVFGVLMLSGMDATTAIFRAAIVATGVMALIGIFRYLTNIIVPQLRARADVKEENQDDQ
jgi:hypothetical protein